MILFLRIVLVAIFIAPVQATAAEAQETQPSTADASVARGLDFLASQQNPEGSFGPSQHPACTGLALLAFLSSGQTADVGKHGPGIRAAIEYLVSACGADGAFNRERDANPMHGQAIATLALTQAYGVEENEDDRRRIASVLFRSVPYILKAQDVKKPEPFAGGWRWTADARDSDVAVTCWTLLALQACRDVGVKVPPESLSRGGAFLLKCWDPQAHGFAYQPHGPAIQSCTGATVFCLRLLDNSTKDRFGARPEVRHGTEYLLTHPIDDRTPYLYNAMYFISQAAWHAGGSVWTTLSKSTFDRLTKLQKPDGGWPQTNEGPGRAYTTSLVLLTLSTPYRLLPIDAR